MALSKEKIRLLLNKARNFNEFKAVVERVLDNLAKSGKAIDGLLMEVSSSRTLVRVLAAAKAGGNETVEIIRRGSGRSNAGYVAPNMKLIKSNWIALDEAYYYTELLSGSLVPELVNSYKKQSAKLVATIEASVKEYRAKIDKALKVIQGLGAKHIPTRLKETATKVEEDLKQRFAKLYEVPKYKASIYVAPTELDSEGKGNLGYFYYMNFPGLKGEGKVYSEFYVVVIGVINEEGNINIKATVLGKFMMPNVIPVDTLKNISSPGAIIEELEAQMFTLFNINVVKRLALPADFNTKAFKKAPAFEKANIKKYIQSKSVVDDNLVLKLVPSVKADELNQVISLVYPILKGMLGILSKDKRVLTSEPTKEGRSYVLTFSLQPNIAVKGGAVGTELDVNKIRELQVQLDLSDETVDDVIRVIQNAKRKRVPRFAK
jgi:hypothetical protein